MNKKISRKVFLKNNVLTWGGLSFGLGVPYNFHTKSFLSKGNIKQDSVLREVDSTNSLLPLISGTSKKLSNQQKQFLFENVELPLLMDFRPAQAALSLVRAVSEVDNKRATDLLEEAIKPLEQLEIEILSAERAPFENWYRQTWIRSASSSLNVHRPYHELRDFITSNKKASPIKPKEKTGHQIEQAKVWSKFLDDMEKLNLK